MFKSAVKHSNNKINNKILFFKFRDPNFQKKSNDNQKNNLRDKSHWSSFTRENPNIFNIKATEQKENLDIFEIWRKRHEYWYYTLPNNIFDECYLKYECRNITEINSIIEKFITHSGFESSKVGSKYEKLSVNSKIQNLFVILFFIISIILQSYFLN